MRFFFISYRRACLSGSGVHDEFLIDVHEIRQSFFILPSEIDAPLYRKKQQFFFGSFFLSSRCISLFIQTEPRKRKIVIKELETPPQKKTEKLSEKQKKIVKKKNKKKLKSLTEVSNIFLSLYYPSKNAFDFITGKTE